MPFDTSHARPIVIALAASVVMTGCASSGQPAGRDHVADALRSRAGVTIRTDPGPPTLPRGTSLDDGLTAADAVAIALWNSPAFEATLTELGLARADVVEAGLLRNPVLSLLLPWGPKQLEWTLQMPFELLWQRPRRVAMATVSAAAVGERLVFEGLRLIADARQAFADAVGSERRLRLAAENETLAGRIAGIADARLRAGDISELEARAARADAAQAAATVRSLEHDVLVARIALASRIGLDLEPGMLLVAPESGGPGCRAVAALLEEALASRPDVRAAELQIEAAGRRVKWERARIGTLIATLDANAGGKEGYEMGPGVAAELPLLFRNQGLRARAAAELERASLAYVALRAQVTAEVRTANARLAQAQQALEIWSKTIIPELEIELRQAEVAYQAGETPLLALLDVGRRLVQARMRSVEAAIERDRAVIGVERSVGRGCES